MINISLQFFIFLSIADLQKLLKTTDTKSFILDTYIKVIRPILLILKFPDRLLVIRKVLSELLFYQMEVIQ